MWPDTEATGAQWTMRPPVKTCEDSTDAHDVMDYQMQLTCHPAMSSTPPTTHNDYVTVGGRLMELPVSCSIGSGTYVETEHTTAGTSTAGCMEVDSAMPQPKIADNPANEWGDKDETLPSRAESRYRSWANEQIAVEQHMSASEESRIARYRQLIDDLLQQCSMLTIERDAMARTLSKVRQNVIEQQVSRMEDKAQLDDIITRLCAHRSALKATLDSQNSSRSVEPSRSFLSHCVRPSTGGHGQRKRHNDVVDREMNGKQRRCS
jgi:hypothetical protein